MYCCWCSLLSIVHLLEEIGVDKHLFGEAGAGAVSLLRTQVFTVEVFDALVEALVRHVHEKALI